MWYPSFLGRLLKINFQLFRNAAIAIGRDRYVQTTLINQG
ncbi:hypothetical protein NSP_46950 [Nodularia spumigena CCY9414]|nr:hypothetical protein NSP_46950 [Nodularia spumigena CCY9414]